MHFSGFKINLSAKMFKLRACLHGGGGPQPGEVKGRLSSDVFERRTSTGSEVFSLLTCLDDIKFGFLSFFTVIEAI